MTSKMGWHVNFATVPDVMVAQAERGRPAVILWLNLGDSRTVWRLKEVSPETLIIGRKFFRSQPLDNPEGRANDAVRAILGSTCAREGAIDTFQIYNEVGPHITEDYRDFDVEAARLLHAEGLKHVAGSWSTGTPEVLPINPDGTSDWTSHWMRPVLQVTDYIGTHSYCAPRMDDPRGLDPAHPGEGWFCARFVKARRILMEAQLGFALPPWVISECGIDSGATKWDAGNQGGWRSFVSAAEYLKDLQWYDAILQLYPWMVGGAVYCYGTLDPYWDSYDIIGEMAELLTGRMEAELGQGPGPPPYPDWLMDLRAILPKRGSYNVRAGGLASVRKIVIHHSQAAPIVGPWQIAEFHIADPPGGHGWPEIGYQAAAAVDGRVWQCVDWEKHSYHAKETNADSIGICLLGDFRNGYEPPESQLAGVRRLISYLEALVGRPLQILGHKDVNPAKVCPGDTWDAWKHRLLGGPDPEPDWERMYHEAMGRVDVLGNGMMGIGEIVETVMA